MMKLVKNTMAFTMISAAVLMTGCGKSTSDLEGLIDEAEAKMKDCKGNMAEVSACVSQTMQEYGTKWGQMAEQLSNLSEDEAAQLITRWTELSNSLQQIIQDAVGNN